MCSTIWIFNDLNECVIYTYKVEFVDNIYMQRSENSLYLHFSLWASDDIFPHIEIVDTLNPHFVSPQTCDWLISTFKYEYMKNIYIILNINIYLRGFLCQFNTCYTILNKSAPFFVVNYKFFCFDFNSYWMFVRRDY